MKNLRNLILVVITLILYGCDSIPKLDDVIPDKRTEYRKSRDLPALEVPPDLTVNSNDDMSIPSDAESTSLSEFQRQRTLSNSANSSLLLGAGEEDGERWLVLQGSSQDIWPKLREFWTEKGFELDLDDAELGVMETKWKARDAAGGTLRDKYRIFTEPDETGSTILFLSSEMQAGSEGEWLDSAPDTQNEEEIVRALKLHFYGASALAAESAGSSGNAGSTAKPKPRKPQTEILNLDGDKSYLAIPKEFTHAWRDTETVLQRAGYAILDSNQEKGTYNFLYYRPKGAKDKGFFNKLKFWGDDDEGIPYQLSLTGVGDKTEVIIMDEDGEWETGEDAGRIMSNLKNLYNNL